ncbi:MAG: tripartite tricarboxylate transporter substrate binding protein [Betaproteobacteria bacterium]
MFTLKRQISIFIFVLGLLHPYLVSAQEYPNKPVRVIVPFAVGGGADIVARLVFQKLSLRLGQSFIIDNRGGAGGIAGTDAVAKSAPDGYTLLLGQTGPNAINPSLFPQVPYDPEKDFAPIIQLTSFSYVVGLNNQIPAKNLQEFVRLVKDNPEKYSFASAGMGSSGQIAAEQFMRATGTKMVHIPYKGGGPALIDAMAGVVSLTFGDIAAITPMVQANRINAVAVTSKNRSKFLPNIPTVAESGYPGFEALAWQAVLAPAKTPPAIINKLNTELNEVLKDNEVREKLLSNGLEIVGGTPKEFGDYIRSEIIKYKKIIQEANIKID